MTSRYVFCPMTSKRLGRRLTLTERIRKYFKKEVKPDVFPICGYNAPIYPGK